MNPAEGLLTWEEFVDHVNRFLAKSSELNDTWKLNGDLATPGAAYISCEKIQTLKRLNNSDEPNPDLIACEITEIKDIDPLEERVENTRVIRYEYHVVYSVSYMVPILCFNAWKEDGTLLTVGEVQTHIPTVFRTAFHEETYLSQMDHPVLMRPFITLHPCKTSEVLSAMWDKSANILTTFISSMGNVVGLTLRLGY